MASKSAAGPQAASPVQAESGIAPWLPLIIIVIAQIQMAFNVNALPVSIGPIVEDLGVPATDVGTALVFYSLVVAGFVMLGAKLGKMVGERLAFQVTALLHGLAMGYMALANSSRDMNIAQALAGLAAAVLVPSLVVLIAANYRGRQQAQALGILAGSPALSGAAAFFLAGWLGTALSWRISFALLFFVSLFVFFLSFRLNPVPRQRGVKLDLVGAVFAFLAIAMISLGFNNLQEWGIIVAKAAAPFAPLGISPAPLMIVLGLLLGQGFFLWADRRKAQNRSTLIALEVIDTKTERAALYTLLIIGALGPAVNFLIPLYMQIVQGQSSLQTAIAVIPYTLSIAFAAFMIVRLYGRLNPKQIGAVALVLVTAGLVMLAFAIRNEWQTLLVILGLMIIGLGEGSLLTLLFNVLVSESPKALAGDVGALRGVANNLSTGLGTAFAGVFAVGVLAFFVGSSVAQSPIINDALLNQLNLDNVNFLSNDQLGVVLDETTATDEQVAEAVRINTQVRLQALKVSFLVLAMIAALGVIPALGLPRYSPGEVPPDGVAKPPAKVAKRK